MHFFRIKPNTSPPAPATDDASETAAQQPQEEVQPKIGFSEMPNEIKAAIFGAIDVRDTDGVKAFDNLRATNRNFQAVGNDLLLRAITPKIEEADTDMAALREQLDGAWLAEDDSRDIHAARRHLQDNARNRDMKRTRAHRPTAIKLHGQAIASSAFSPSGRFMAIGDQDGGVSLIDMQTVKQQAQRHEAPSEIRSHSPAAIGVPRLPGSAIALAFSADDTTLAVAHRHTEFGDSASDVPDDYACYVVVYDLTKAKPQLTFKFELPEQIHDVGSVALDARGTNVMVAMEGAKALIHTALNAPTLAFPRREAVSQPIPVAHRCDGEVAYTNRGTVMYGTRDGHEEAVGAPKGAVIRGGTRRPFVMPHTSQLARRLLTDTQMSQDAKTHVTWVLRDQSPDLQLSTFIDGDDPHIASESIDWDHRKIPSVLFAPGNRHVLVTSKDSGDAVLVDTAPPATLEEADADLKQMASSESKTLPEPHRRRPIKSALPGKQTIRHALNKLRRPRF